MGLIERQSGEFDGSGPEAAIPVDDVAGEYRWVLTRCPGFQVVHQALTKVGGKHYDVLTLRDEGGRERKVYFDVSKFLG
jgi:hypothetical protein